VHLLLQRTRGFAAICSPHELQAPITNIMKQLALPHAVNLSSGFLPGVVNSSRHLGKVTGRFDPLVRATKPRVGSRLPATEETLTLKI